MTETQIIFTIALLGAVLVMAFIERPQWWLAALFLASIVLGVINQGKYIELGVGDTLLSLVALNVGGKRGYITAGLFAAMAATYATGALINVPEYAIYGIVELLCVACLGVMVNADRWGSGTRRRIGRTRRALGDAVGRDNTYGVGVNMLRSTQEKAR